jgi:hypothetical protein
MVGEFDRLFYVILVSIIPRTMMTDQDRNCFLAAGLYRATKAGSKRFFQADHPVACIATPARIEG